MKTLNISGKKCTNEFNEAFAKRTGGKFIAGLNGGGWAAINYRSKALYDAAYAQAQQAGLNPISREDRRAAIDAKIKSK